MNEEMQKTGRLGRRTWDVALVFFLVFWSSHYSNAPFRVRSMAPKRRSLNEVELQDWKKAWMLEADLSLYTGEGEEEDKQFWGQIEAMAGMVGYHAGQEAYVVRWIGEKGKGITLSWHKGHFYASDSHPSLVNFARPGDFARQLGIVSQD